MFAEATGMEDGGGTSQECHVADQLMKKRGADNYKKAYTHYKALLQENPSDEVLKLKVKCCLLFSSIWWGLRSLTHSTYTFTQTAEAAVALLRTETNANSLTLKGTMDTTENIKLWKAYAPEAYTLLKELHKTKPQDAKIHVLMTEAYTYQTSAAGILKAAVTGAGVTFMRYVDQITKAYPTYDSGVSHIFKGAFLIAAPWPLKDIKGAVKAFDTALQVEPNSLRNNYFVGIASHYAGDLKRAAHHFEKAINEAESIADSEKDVAAFFRSEAKRSLDETRKTLKEKEEEAAKGK